MLRDLNLGFQNQRSPCTSSFGKKRDTKISLLIYIKQRRVNTALICILHNITLSKFTMVVVVVVMVVVVVEGGGGGSDGGGGGDGGGWRWWW